MKAADVLKGHPSCNNNIEAYHRVFKRILTRVGVPIYLAVSMAFNLAETRRIQADKIERGAIRPARGATRSKQAGVVRLGRSLNADEYFTRKPENSTKRRKTGRT